MKSFFDYFDGYKTFIGAALSTVGGVATIAIACGVPGVIPLVVAGSCAVGGSAISIIGRLHSGVKLADQQGQIIDLVNQVKAIRGLVK